MRELTALMHRINHSAGTFLFSILEAFMMFVRHLNICSLVIIVETTHAMSISSDLSDAIELMMEFTRHLIMVRVPGVASSLPMTMPST